MVDLITDFHKRICNLNDTIISHKRKQPTYTPIIIGLTNFLLYHCNYSIQLTETWFKELTKQPQNTIIYMFFSLTDLLRQSLFRSQEMYVIPFAEMLKVNINLILRKITNQQLLSILEEEISNWEAPPFPIYQRDFIMFLITCITQHRYNLINNSNINSTSNTNDIVIPDNTVVTKQSEIEAIKCIVDNELTRNIFALNVEENNIINYNHAHINASNLETFLMEYPRMDEKTANAVEVCEGICVNYRMYILNDLIKREKLIYELTCQLEQLRESYLKEENKTKMK